MITRNRILLGLAMTLSILAMCTVCMLPETPLIREWHFDVTSSASLEGDCARASTSRLPDDAELLLDGFAYGRMYFGGATHSYQLTVYRTSIFFRPEAQGERPSLHFQFTGDAFQCGFDADGSHGILILGLYSKFMTKNEVLAFMRDIARSAGASPDDLRRVISQFEEGGIGLDFHGNTDFRNSYRLSDHALRIVIPGLTFWFSVEDLGGHSEPPSSVAPDWARYSMSLGFAPAR